MSTKRSKIKFFHRSKPAEKFIAWVDGQWYTIPHRILKTNWVMESMFGSLETEVLDFGDPILEQPYAWESNEEPHGVFGYRFLGEVRIKIEG